MAEENKPPATKEVITEIINCALCWTGDDDSPSPVPIQWEKSVEYMKAAPELVAAMQELLSPDPQPCDYDRARKILQTLGAVS